MSSTVVLTAPVTTVHTESTAVLTTSRMAKPEVTNDATFTVVFNSCSSGLGIKIIGGLAEEEDDQDFGIFIKKILPGGLAELDGHLCEGDQLLEVNGEGLEDVTNDRAVQLLRQASAINFVKLLVCRDDRAREEYMELLNAYSYSSASSMCSQDSTPTITDQHNSWASPVSPAYSSASGPITSHPYRHRSGDGSSSVNEIEPMSAVNNAAPHAGSRLGGRYTLPMQAKVPNAAAAAAFQRHGLLMAPAMASTPQQSNSMIRNLPNKFLLRDGALKHSPPDGASGASPSSQLSDLDPSPVAGAELHLSTHSAPPGAPSHDYTPQRLRNGAVLSPHMQARGAGPRRLSLDPYVRLKVGKLEMALKYLGLDPKPGQQAEIRQRLTVDAADTVPYGEFVRVAREVFKMQIEERNISPSAMYLAANDIKDFTDPPAFQSQVRQAPDLPINDELELVRKERDELQREVSRLKVLLRERERACNVAEDELLTIRHDAQGAMHDSRSLRSKVHLAEQAQRAARNMEQDYEEVVHVLEEEIAELRIQQSKHMEHPAVQKRLAVLGCQLRKAEVSKKTYEVATEKLLQFAEEVHDVLSGHGDGLPSKSDPMKGEASRGSRPPSYLGKHKQHHTAPQHLAVQAREVVRTVKSLVEVEPLPFGWDEAYTTDGMRYYINHVIQMTSWSHPLSNVQQDAKPPTAAVGNQTVSPGNTPAAVIGNSHSPSNIQAPPSAGSRREAARRK